VEGVMGDIMRDARKLAYKVTKSQWHIKTHTTRHFISTVWLEMLGMYETMTFDKRKERIDWAGTDTNRTTSKRIAIANHFKAVRKALGSHAKNA
jgi:hypothetical protein